MCECSTELRDRVIKLETNHDHLKEAQTSTKNEFAEFKKEVLSRFDDLGNQINGIKMTLAKYLGIAIGLLFVLEVALKVLVK